jgi:FtsH-binding integral membrane protein
MGQEPTLLTSIEAFVQNPFFGLAVAIVLTVVGSKLTANASGLLLTIAWLLASVSLFRTVPIKDQKIIPRILWTTLASVVGLALYKLDTWNPQVVPSAAQPSALDTPRSP